MHLEIYTAYDEQGDETFTTAHLVFTIFGLYISFKFGDMNYRFMTSNHITSSFRVHRLDRTRS